jgi:hypothetical protein
MLTMKTLRWLLVAVGLALATPALAYECPSLMRKIDAAVKTATLPPAQMDEVKKLRVEGERLHKEGGHNASIDTLRKAMQILKI